MAIQIAKQLGAVVIATGGSDKKLEVMKSLGADYVFNRFKDDIPAEVKKIATYGVDAVLDYIATQTFPKSFGMLKKGGRMMLCGMHTGRETTLSIHMTYLNCLSLLGFYLGTREEMQTLIDWVAQKKVKPYIGEVLDLKDAARAHEMMETGNLIGKVALKV
jgi:alcohol dehydrogenase